MKRGKNRRIEACPVFMRWQVNCLQCGITFYVDTEPETTKEDILKLEFLKCESHPLGNKVLTLA
jgi:hypothetical protein